MTTPTTSVEHLALADAMNQRIRAIDPVLARVRNEAFELTLLALIYYVRHAIPGADYIAMSVTDQGGDTMTFDHIGVLREKYEAFTDPMLAGSDPDIELIEWISSDPNEPLVKGEFAQINASFDIFNVAPNSPGPCLDEDQMWEYCATVEDYQLTEWGRFWEQTGGKHSGTGRLWIDRCIEALLPTFEGFVGETLDPMPDPNDKVAIAEWISRATAPKES